MKKIIDFLPKPSDAVRAMIEGLEEQSKRKDFEISMDTYGVSVRKGLQRKDENFTCFGCAATCAIQKAVGINLTHFTINQLSERSDALGIEFNDLDEFEGVIDRLRRGISTFENTAELGIYYGVKIPEPLVELPELNSNTWKENLGPYRAYLQQLLNAGL